VQSIDMVKGYASWVERDAGMVEDWLTTKGYMN
jgi:hypothetical protein